MKIYKEQKTKYVVYFAQFKSDLEYQEFLSSGGMTDVKAVFEKHTIIVRGKKK